MSQSSRHGTSARAAFLPAWAAATGAGAVLVTAADAALLERSKGFFTGGFLAEDYLTGAGQTAAFLGLSVLADAAVIGVIAAAALWCAARLRIRRTPATAAALVAGVAPLAIADVVAYELSAYMGDVLDMSLALDLAGGNPFEVLAVVSSHAVAPALMIAAGAGGAGGFVWLTSRFSRARRPVDATARQCLVPGLVAVSGLLLATAAAASSDVLENGLLRKPSGKVLASVAASLTDFDRDGFGIAGRMVDPDLFDARVFPYALDRPGNGVDENGVGGDLPADAAPYREVQVASAPWQRRPDVVLIVLESFRADLVGAWHDGRPITPVLDGLAAEGLSVPHAYSHNGYTAPSRFHLFSGALVAATGAPTLIDDFKRNGYFVGYFSGQDESFGDTSYAVGYDRADVSSDARTDRDRRYSTFTTAGSLAVPYTVVVERVSEFLKDRVAAVERPLFLSLNFHDTHFPYAHSDVDTLVSKTRLPRSAIVPGARDDLWATYANTAANVDRAVGEVLDAVRQARGRHPAVIVTADHGESLFDEGFLGHGYVLNDVQTRIPLIVTGLPIALTAPVGQRDLRHALARALSRPHDEDARPALVETPDREVFQYLGSLHRPRQIAFLRIGGRTIYDFRSRKVSIRGGAWQAPDQLSGEARAEFLRLVHMWEGMMHLRASARTADAEE